MLHTPSVFLITILKGRPCYKMGISMFPLPLIFDKIKTALTIFSRYHLTVLIKASHTNLFIYL